MSLKCYWVAHIDPTSRKYHTFQDEAVDVIERLGGRILARGSHGTTLSGKFRERTIIIEFDDAEHAMSAFQSEEHQSVRKLLEDQCDFDLQIIPGLTQDEGPPRILYEGKDWQVKA